jgi:hypothetical protein
LRKFDSLLYKSIVKIPTDSVLIKLKISTPTQNAENASVTVSPKILPPNKYAYVGKIKKRFDINATPVAIKQDPLKDSTTVFKFLRY